MVRKGLARNDLLKILSNFSFIFLLLFISYSAAVTKTVCFLKRWFFKTEPLK